MPALATELDEHGNRLVKNPMHILSDEESEEEAEQGRGDRVATDGDSGRIVSNPMGAGRHELGPRAPLAVGGR